MAEADDAGVEARRNEPPPFHRYRFANVEFDESVGRLRVAGADVAIEPRPRNLLSELLRRPNEVISKDELLDLLWDGRPTVDNVLANAVNKLRKALGDEGGARIISLARVGYRLAGPIERIVVGQHAASAAGMAVGQAVPGREAYRLEQSLGRAERGQVWLARDAKLQEVRVFKFATDSERLTALKREYTLYRVLRTELGERSDFAQVLSANFSSSPYFLECEYGGQDLLAWAAEGDRLATMDVTGRLALFLQIARAVAAAHGVGVLHKDLKPANVLIRPSGDDWAASLTDFGSSRLLEPGRLEQLGVTALGLTLTQGVSASSDSGTPLYLAPELLAGHSPSTQSDLYALGLMLYQMLVGDLRRPMVTGWQREIDDELLREDLTAATEGRLQDRLGSVAALVERLATVEQRREERLRFQVEARAAASVADQLGRTRSRRPWVIAAFSCLCLGLALGGWFYAQARTALRHAEQESTRAQAINDFLTKDVLLSPDAIRSASIKSVSMLDIVRRASERAAARFREQPRTEASIRYELARIYMRMASNTDASNELDRALALLKQSGPASDTLALSVRFSTAQLLVRMSQTEDARRMLEEAEADAGRALLDRPSELALLARQARFEFLLELQQNADALPIALQMVVLADSVPGFDLAIRFEARQNLAELYGRLGDIGQAEAILKEIMRPPYSATGVGEVLHARAAVNSATVHKAMGRVDEAEAELVAARDRLTRTLGPNELQVGLVNHDLGALYESRGEFAKAEKSLTEALMSFRAALGNDHQYVHIMAVNVAEQHLSLGRSAAALRMFDAELPWFKAHAPSRKYVPLDWGRAKALSDLGRSAEALVALDSMTPEDLANNGVESDWRWQVQAERGRALLNLGRRDDGVALLLESLASMERLNSPPPMLARYRKLLPGPPRSHTVR